MRWEEAAGGGEEDSELDGGLKSGSVLLSEIISPFIPHLTTANYLHLLCVGEHQLHKNILLNPLTKVLD